MTHESGRHLPLSIALHARHLQVVLATRRFVAQRPAHPVTRSPVSAACAACAASSPWFSQVLLRIRAGRNLLGKPTNPDARQQTERVTSTASSHARPSCFPKTDRTEHHLPLPGAPGLTTRSKDAKRTKHPPNRLRIAERRWHPIPLGPQVFQRRAGFDIGHRTEQKHKANLRKVYIPSLTF